MSDLLVRIRGLTVRYPAARGGAPALSAIDLDVRAGERLAVIGESGSGKSTLALAIAGLLPERATVEGRIDWPGLSGPPRPGRDIGMVFQNPDASLDPVMRIGAQVAEAARFGGGLDRRAAAARAVDLIDRVRLPDPARMARAYPHQMSGGQRQRAAIAAAIAGRPTLLIADEATSALDTVVQADLVALLDGLVRAEGMTLIFITHDIALASSFADRLAVMGDGRLQEAGPARRVLTAPESAATSALMAAHIDLSTPPRVGQRP